MCSCNLIVNSFFPDLESDFTPVHIPYCSHLLTIQHSLVEKITCHMVLHKFKKIRITNKLSYNLVLRIQGFDILNRKDVGYNGENYFYVSKLKQGNKCKHFSSFLKG